MSDNDQRNQGSERKPLLAYANASKPFTPLDRPKPEAARHPKEPVSIVPPWVPAAQSTPEPSTPEPSGPEAKPEIALKPDKQGEPEKCEKTRSPHSFETTLIRQAKRDHTSLKIMVATMLIGGIAATVYALSHPQRVTATAQLYIGQRIEEQPTSSHQPQIRPESPERMIMSDGFLNKVAAETGLASDAEFNEALNQSGWSRLWQQFCPVPSPQVTGTNEVIENLRNHLQVQPATSGNSYTLDVTTKTGTKSVKIANAIGTVLKQEVEAAQLLSRQHALNEIAAQKMALLQAAEQAEKDLADYRATHGAHDGQDGSTLAQNEIALAKQQNVTADLREKLQSLEEATAATIVASDTPDAALSDRLINLRARYAQARQNLNRLTVELPPLDRQLIEAQSQVSALGSQINAELIRLRSSLMVEIQRSEEKESELATKIAQDNAQMPDHAADIVALQTLEKQAAQKRATYNDFLRQAEKNPATHNVPDIEVKFIEDAKVVPASHDYHRQLIMLAGLLGGLLIGALLAALRLVVCSRR